MINKEKVSGLLANSYFQAASIGCDMHRMAEYLETIRSLSLNTDNFKIIEDRIDIYLGESLDNEQDFGVILQLREQYRFLERVGFKDEIIEISQTDANRAWNRWLEIFGFELSQLKLNTCQYLLKIKAPGLQQADHQFIKRCTDLLSDERWVEGGELVEYFIEKTQMPDSVKADLYIISGQIKLYHLLDFKKAFEYFNLGITLIPGTAKAERVLGEYYIENKGFDLARTHLQKALDLDAGDYENYVILGNLYKAENRLDTAAGWYQEGTRKSPGKADLYDKLLLLNAHPSYFLKHHQEIDDLLKTIGKLDPDYLYSALNNAAFVYQKNGDFEKVEEYYQKAIQLHPSRIQTYINQGYTYLEKEDIDKSEKAFQKSIELDKKAFEGYWGFVALNRKKEDYHKVIANLKICEKYRPYWLPYIYNDYGNAYEKLNDIKNAQKYYLLALEHDAEKNLGLAALYDIVEFHLDFKSGILLLGKMLTLLGQSFAGSIYYRIGVIYYKNLHFKEAIDQFRKALKTDPDDPVKLEYLGLAHEKTGNYKKAEEIYRKAIEKASGYDSKYYNRLAFFLTERKRYDESVELLKIAIQAEPNPIYFENLGYAYENLGKLEEAEHNYVEALNVSASDKDIYYNRLGIFYDNQKEIEKAIGYYQKAIDLNAKADYFENIGNLYKISGNAQRYEEAFVQAAQLEPHQGKYFFQLGWNLLSEFKDTEKAKLYLTKALEIYRNTPEIEPEELLSIQFLGAAYQQEFKLDEAEKIFIEASKLDSKNDLIYSFLGRIYLDKNDLKKSLKNYEKALKLNPSKVLNFKDVGVVLEQLGEHEKAIKVYKKGAELDQNLNEKIARIYFDQKDYMNAGKYIREAIAKFPENPIYWENLGLALQYQQKFEEAESAFVTAMNIGPPEEADIYFNYLGNLWIAQGQFETAASFYQKAVELNPKSAVYLDNLGFAYENLERPEEAVKVYLEGAAFDGGFYEKAAKVYFLQSDYINAEKYIRIAIEKMPDNPVYHQNLAKCLEMLGLSTTSR